MEKLDQDNKLCCRCGDDFLHLVAKLEFKDNDLYQVTSVLVNGRYEITFNSPIAYPYRSQGNIHLLFAGECGHYSSKSFDGHKGNMFLDENDLMDKLCNFLNWRIDEAQVYFEYKLLAEMERFFQISSETPMNHRRGRN